MKTTKTDYAVILLMPFGIALPAIAIMLDRMAEPNVTIDFIIGLLFGLSVVFNICFIIIMSYRLTKYGSYSRTSHKKSDLKL